MSGGEGGQSLYCQRTLQFGFGPDGDATRAKKTRKPWVWSSRALGEPQVEDRASADGRRHGPLEERSLSGMRKGIVKPTRKTLCGAPSGRITLR